jgi:predicted nucleic acid-binding protein
VPATRRRLTEFPPSRLYLDTNFLLNALIPSYPYHELASGFFLHLATTGITTLYISSLTWLEFAYVVLRPAFISGLDADLQRDYRLAEWDQAAIQAAYRDRYLVAMVDRVLAVLSEFAWDEISVTPDVSMHALQLMGQYALRGQDAAHVACAQAVGVLDLASFDAGFRRVDGLHLWSL